MQQKLINLDNVPTSSSQSPQILVDYANRQRSTYESTADASRDRDRDERIMRMLGDMMLAEEWAEYHFLPSLAVGHVDITVLSHGAGSQTSALAALAAVNGFSESAPGEPGHIDIDVAMFANVGDQGRPNEWPETIEYLWNLDRITYLPIVRVDPYVWNRTLEIQNDTRGLFDRYFDRETMPFRSFRGCTDMFKIIPQESFISWLIDEAGRRGTHLTIRQVIGYSVDEESRAEKFHASHPNVRPYFPLIEWGWRRNDTVRKLKELAPDVINTIGPPEKSGCWFCPFQALGDYLPNGRARPRSWVALRDMHPDLMDYAHAMEARQNARRLTEGKKEAFLAGDKPLSSLLASRSHTPVSQSALAGFDDAAGDDTCTSWGCFR